jgi:hypothetical protein
MGSCFFHSSKLSQMRSPTSITHGMLTNWAQEETLWSSAHTLRSFRKKVPEGVRFQRLQKVSLLYRSTTRHHLRLPSMRYRLHHCYRDKILERVHWHDRRPVRLGAIKYVTLDFCHPRTHSGGCMLPNQPIMLDCRSHYSKNGNSCSKTLVDGFVGNYGCNFLFTVNSVTITVTLS